jgi:hypothetical protein
MSYKGCSDEVDEKHDLIAYPKILAGRESPRNHGRNNNSPATGCCTNHDLKCVGVTQDSL